MRSVTELLNENEILRMRIAMRDREVVARDEEIKKLREMLLVDPMTGLLNRAGFTHHLGALLSLQSRSGGATFVVFLDIDNFKIFNTNFGHDGGDYTIIALANRFKALMRQHDAVGRWAGDEFVIAFHLDSDEILAGTYQSILDRISHHCCQPVTKGDLSYDVTCSMGVCRYSRIENQDPLVLINAADKAMFAAKANGKRCIVEIEI